MFPLPQSVPPMAFPILINGNFIFLVAQAKEFESSLILLFLIFHISCTGKSHGLHPQKISRHVWVPAVSPIFTTTTLIQATPRPAGSIAMKASELFFLLPSFSVSESFKTSSPHYIWGGLFCSSG